MESGVGKVVTDHLQRLGLEPTIEVMLLVIVGGMVIKSLLLLLANRQVGYTVAHVATSLRLELIDALLASRWEYYLRQPTGSLANSIATEAYRAAIGFQYGAMVIALFIQVVVYTVVAVFVSWPATLVSLVVGATFLFALHRLVRAARRAGSRQTRLLRSLLAYLTDVLGSVKSLKAMARDNVADAVLRDQTVQLEKAMRREVMSKETLRALQEPMLAALAALGLYLALVHWRMSLAEVMVLVFLLVRIISQLGKSQRQFQHMITQESAYWALRTAAEDARRAAECAGGRLQPSLNQGLRLEEVGFAYGPKQIFSALNLNIPVRRFTVVVGPSGIGKSTLLDLLCGLVEPGSGAVLVDGVALRDINLRSWRKMLGYVPQETILLHDSVLNNVVAGEPGLTRTDAEKALRQAGAWDFVCGLPDGPDTIIGERGGLISGGQRQRV
ncbi:MAG: ATP-binding cassette domain-containing protein, partial [Gammaproteobacteria bacterium]